MPVSYVCNSFIIHGVFTHRLFWCFVIWWYACVYLFYKTKSFDAFFFIDEKFLKFSDLLESSINVNVMKVLYIDYRRSYICDCYLKRCGNVYYRCLLLFICMSVYNWIMCKVLILQLFSLTLKVKRVWFSTVTISHMTVHKIYVMSSNVQGGIM